MSRLRTFALTVASMTTIAAAPAVGHHSAAAYFELGEEVTVTGSVEELVFSAPHAVLRFTVTNENGEQELWRAETLPSNLLYHRGWRYNMFEEGEEITVTGNPSRDSSLHALNLRSVTTSDGRIITAAGVEEPQ